MANELSPSAQKKKQDKLYLIHKNKPKGSFAVAVSLIKVKKLTGIYLWICYSILQAERVLTLKEIQDRAKGVYGAIEIERTVNEMVEAGYLI